MEFKSNYVSISELIFFTPYSVWLEGEGRMRAGVGGGGECGEE